MIAVDASVAAKWILNERYSDQARTLLKTAMLDIEPIVAPPLLPSEVTNILRQRMRREGLPLEAAQRLLAQFLAIPVELRAPDTLYQRALAIAERYQLSAAYDAHYIALAEHLGCVLWTDDQRLLTAVRGSQTFVRPIAEYGAS